MKLIKKIPEKFRKSGSKDYIQPKNLGERENIQRVKENKDRKRKEEGAYNVVM